MFTIFKNKEQTKEFNRKLVKQIHNEFHTKGDLLVKEARKLLCDETFNRLKEKKELLHSCGFSNTKLSESIKLEEEKISDSEVISKYYTKMNGMYKVITLESIKEITRKYKLCMGLTSGYNEDVPVKNLLDIKKFKASFSKSEGYHSTDSTNNSNFCICAPKGDFHTRAILFVDQGNIIKFEDPIVLYPCNNYLDVSRWDDALSTKYYYVVTAWGDEASDPIVVNNKFN